jgi:hypothetical protein
VKLTVTSTTGTPNPIPANTLLTLWRIHPDGSEHRVIAASEVRVIGGAAATFDYHPPYNVPITYRVEAAGVAVVSGPVFVQCGSTWLISASTPALSVEVPQVAAIGELSRPTRSGEFVPIGGESIFINDGRRGGKVGSMAIRLPYELADAVWDLLDDDGVILINTPGTAGWDIKWQWVQVQDQGFANQGQVVWFRNRVFTLPFKASGDPDVDLVNPWNAGVAAAYFAANGITAGGTAALYATALDLETNTRL